MNALTTPKIEFKNITKIFQTRSQTIVAVKDYSMQVAEGDFVSIIGPCCLPVDEELRPLRKGCLLYTSRCV